MYILKKNIQLREKRNSSFKYFSISNVVLVSVYCLFFFFYFELKIKQLSVFPGVQLSPSRPTAPFPTGKTDFSCPFPSATQPGTHREPQGRRRYPSTHHPSEKKCSCPPLCLGNTTFKYVSRDFGTLLQVLGTHS